MEHQELKNAVDITQRAQRNYDLSKSIPQADLDTLIYTALNSPSKQNETHFKLKVYTDPNLIHNIYDCTKRFGLIGDNFDKMYKDTDKGVIGNNKYEVKNSQVLANVVFVYCDEDQQDEDNLRGSEQIIANRGNASEETTNFFTRLKNFSIGISSGQLSLVAALLGYKTGFCSGYSTSQLKAVIKDEPRLLVGIGYENSNMDRRLHGTLFNKDIPKQYRTGEDNERWKFPSFDKTIKVMINNNEKNNTTTK